MTARLRVLQQAFGGDLSGRTLHAPTIGHSQRDRGTTYTDAPGAPGDLLVSVFNGSATDALAAKDRALMILGERVAFSRKDSAPVDPAEAERRLEVRRKAEAEHQAEAARRQRRGREIWREACDPRGTIVEAYLRSRGLDLPPEVAGEVLRYSPRCPWGEGGRAPSMIAPLRCVRTGEVVGIHRTALTPDGQKIGRKMLGRALGAAIMLDAEDAVSTGLAIGEGIETCLAARQLGIRPTWALGSTANIAAFPVLDGIESLTLLGELGDGGASDRACTEVGTRWHNAGRAVDIITPKTGNDLNDVVRGGAKTWL